MVKRSKCHNKVVSNPVVFFLNAIATLATVTVTKIRDFAASIVTRAGQFLKTSPVAADDPIAGKSLWSFCSVSLLRHLESQPNSTTHRRLRQPSQRPVSSYRTLHQRPLRNPPFHRASRLQLGDNTDIKIDSNGEYLSRLRVPPRISGCINRYKELSDLFDMWLIEFARYHRYGDLRYCLKADKIHIKIDYYAGLAEDLAHRVNEDVAVREHVQEIVELRNFVNSWYQDVIRRKDLPATCSIAEEARRHQPPYDAMVQVLGFFGGPVP
ncbi:hypothetical protein LTR97_002780 [Elasticomyces elasticus]|uniref:Uncharacterized protein n=1 Tax=Elasticomyces elasticus TaxID=574655 RepID=A0AAN8A4E3_9PEZI|nr:hypothetical protein LTR97_002780 [Elasticomyces elasticus]